MALPIESWSGLELLELVDEGNRNEVWRAVRAGEPCAVRRSRRSTSSLRWELDLIDSLDANGFLVPTVIPTDDGRRHDDHVVVQRWIDGRPPESDADGRAVAAELMRLHRVHATYPQRPQCCIVTELAQQRVSVDADLDSVPAAVEELVAEVFATVADVPTALIHGDPGPSNIRITADGRVGLLDWDESRVDVTWHDLSNLGVQVLADAEHHRALVLSDAWEAINAWLPEPDYAADRLRQLRRRLNEAVVRRSSRLQP